MSAILKDFFSKWKHRKRHSLIVEKICANSAKKVDNQMLAFAEVILVETLDDTSCELT